MINNMNKTPKELWLEEYDSEGTIANNKRNFQQFCKWAKTNDLEIVKEYDAAKNKRRWRKEMGAVILRWYSYLLKEKGMTTNTARSKVTAVRAFLRSQCEPAYIKKGAIAAPKIATGEYEFAIGDLRKMYHFGDVKEKALLSASIALGWGAQDFVALKRAFIEPILEKEPFTGFWYEREKTGAPTRAHLTPEAIDSLKAWLAITPESEYVWTNGNGKKDHLTQETINNILKRIVHKANVKTGERRVRFHAMRKFLFSQLLNSGVVHWHAKIMIGKKVPPDIMTYIKDVKEQLREQYMSAYPRFALIGYTNKNHDRVEQLEKENRFMKMLLRTLIDEKKLNDALEKMKMKTLTEDKEAFMQFRKSMIKDRDQA